MRNFIDIVATAHEAIFEEIYYNGEITPLYSRPMEILVVKNPSKGELKSLMRKAIKPLYSTGKELRALLDTDLLVWDASVASHDDIKKAFQVSGMHMYFYEGFFKMDDYYLRHPDMKEVAVDTVENHSMIQRLYPEGVVAEVDEVWGFCFRPA